MRKLSKSNNVVAIRPDRAAEMRGRPVVGHVVQKVKGGFAVDYPGNVHGPLLARSVVSSGALTRACEGRSQPEVMLAFEGERSDRPVILGLLHPPPEPHNPPEVFVDGRRVVLEGKDEIVLKCGKALLVMRRNGRIVVRGTYVETDSDGVNRIKGGTVEIN